MNGDFLMSPNDNLLWLLVIDQSNDNEHIGDFFRNIKI